MKCSLCGSNGAVIVYSEYPGYIEGSKFDIYFCAACNTSFIQPLDVGKKLYEMIYASFETPGYDRYYKYAQQVKSEKNPLKFLSDSEATFFPVSEFMKEKQNLKILEVGCGYGYLTYAIRTAGHDAFGIDISENAVKFAKENFGEYFSAEDADNFSQKNEKKFDLIIATELIEHVKDPTGLIKTLLKMLAPDGKIIFTTPNKDYFQKGIWQTDPPPLHTFWFSRKSFDVLAEKFSLNVDFTDFSKYSPKKENKLITYLLSRKEKISEPVLGKDGKPSPARAAPYSSPIWNFLRGLLLFYPVRVASNWLHNFFRKDYRTLGVILRKK